ncbi:MAG: hypothetical protein NTY19_37460 [Planctomycetota bacterium]|nr:hypothetical protein [Planctomycetota bacterium]
MTTASAEQVEESRASTDPKRRGGRASSDPSYLVLIRLPLVRMETATEAAAARPAEPQETAPPNPAAIDVVTALSPMPKTAEVTAAAVAPREEPTMLTQSAPRFGSERMTWSRFQGVRLLGQLFVGALVIGLFIAAYAMLAGGPDTPSTAKNPGTPAADQPAPNDSDLDSKTQSQDAAEGQASPPADATTVTPPPAQSLSAPADNEATAESSPSIGRQGREASSPLAATPASSKPLLERGWTADRVMPSPDSSGQDATVQADTGRAVEVAATGGSRSFAPGSQLPFSEQPETASSLGQPNHVNPSSSPYPVTDSSKFQYPAQYHEILRSRANSRSTTDNSTEPVGRNANAWQPNTARLQPSMDPPPIR